MAIKNRMTVSEVADMFGVSVTTVRNWEKEKDGFKRIPGITPVTFNSGDVFNFTQREGIRLVKGRAGSTSGIPDDHVPDLEQIDDACVAAGYDIGRYGPTSIKETREIALKWLEAWRKVL